MAIACASGASAFVAPSLVTQARVFAAPKAVMMCEFLFVFCTYQDRLRVSMYKRSHNNDDVL